MANKKVLLAIDGSQTSEHAFYWYIENLHQSGHEVLVFHALEFPELHVHPRMGLYQEHLLEKFKKQQEEDKVLKPAYEAKLKEKNVSGRYESRQGKPGKTIVEAAKEENADFLVIGSRGHGLVGRAILGSVSTYVMHHAHCPVVIVHKDK